MIIAIIGFVKPDPKYHDLNKNPGLLPLRLGNAQVKTNSWTFVQIYDLSEIIAKFGEINNSFDQLKNLILSTFKNNQTNKEFFNTINIVNLLRNKVKIQFDQLNPILTTRSKRGLINGLGEIIKSITGNLDNSDAEKFENAIHQVSETQNKMKNILNSQITILDSTVQTFKKNTDILSKDQLVLESKVKQIEIILKRRNELNRENDHYLQTQNALAQFILSFQLIYDLLEKIEVAISFSKTNTFHNSIIEPKELFIEIQNVNTLLSNDNKFPFEANIENLLLFERILTIKSFCKDNKIIFAIEIPIVKLTPYEYYHLYSIPTRTQNTFKTIIPSFEYLLLNDISHMLTNQRCQEIISNQYLCEEEVIFEDQQNIPCEVQLLKFSPSSSNCEPNTVKISKTKIKKVERSQWIVVTPSPTVATQQCQGTISRVPLNGTYLLEVNNQCEVKIKNFVLKTFKNFKDNFEPIVLPNIQFLPSSKIEREFEFKDFKLNPIKVKEIDQLHIKLEQQKESLEKLDNPVYFKQTSVYTIFLYFIVITIILCAGYQKYRRLSRKKPNGPDQPIDLKVNFG